jgi:hypothetical protein
MDSKEMHRDDDVVETGLKKIRTPEQSHYRTHSEHATRTTRHQQIRDKEIDMLCCRAFDVDKKPIHSISNFS